ncbi:hypothetical protein B0A52_05222 [Exophiala mesophila]|uniref:FIT family protein scs3 n=1 Tax=Exophiala mesophila TaxID=212818 RepID=A0A438N4G2_EXOME|nr:hypothetical protein B0A52_05222 [Exophiala mesophila]
MPATLRNGKSLPESPTKPSPSVNAFTTAQDGMSRQRPSSYLLLIYPAILAIGSLYSVISPTTFSPTTRPLAPGLTSAHEVDHIPTNYFSGKRNIFNIYFVKLGWFWTTLAFMLLQTTTRPHHKYSSKHYIQAAVRYGLITLSWVLTTQWFFGPALIDRSFTFSGGHCEPPLLNESGIEGALEVTTAASGLTCKAAGGVWRGGYDISGHVFMLVLSSSFLLYELYIADRHSWHPSVSPQAAAKVAHELTTEERIAVGGWESETMARIRLWARYFLYTVVVLDLWMLMMTAIFFHTWLEKLTGLAIAGSSVWATYFLGDILEGWRSIVGGL